MFTGHSERREKTLCENTKCPAITINKRKKYIKINRKAETTKLQQSEPTEPKLRVKQTSTILIKDHTHTDY